MTTTAPTTAPTAAATTEATAGCTLDIGGMTCASCVRRVEKALTRVDGVTAAEGNLATAVPPVGFDPQRGGFDELTAAVTRAGYTAPRRREAPSPAEPIPAED